jgi:hypothetical protein
MIDEGHAQPASDALLTRIATAVGTAESLDGSIWRARDTGGLDPRDVHAAFTIAAEALGRAILRGDIDAADANAVLTHVAARILHEAGQMEYAFRMRGRILMIADRAGALVESLVAEALRRGGLP